VNNSTIANPIRAIIARRELGLVMVPRANQSISEL
jgi:hypothetical protein